LTNRFRDPAQRRYGPPAVIRIELTDDELSRTRLALSPLWELVASLFMLHRPDPPAEHRPWLERTRRALRDVDLGPVDVGIPFSHSCPDFVAPIPVEPLPTLEDEIERVRSTDADVVRADIAECWRDGPPPSWDRFASHPREMCDRLAEALHTYWQVALDDDWPRLRAVLEGEMLGRARSLALAGSAAVLEELHPKVRWRPPVVELYKDKPFDADLAGRPLVLIPLVFAGSVLLANQKMGHAIGLGYQARGIAGLWEPEHGGEDERLEILLGHGRAAVLRGLHHPATTTELAARLGYAPSTVSAHLDVLSRAGLVERHRVRRRVFYAVNDTGASLVTLLAEIPATLSA
jgi:DNA-binding transcriptional ArsR family regulator